MYAYKDVFGGFQATEMHLLVTLMDLFSLTADHIWVGFQSVMGPELKQTPSFGQGFVLFCHEVGNTLPPVALGFHYKCNTPNYFSGFHSHHKLSVHVGSAR